MTFLLFLFWFFLAVIFYGYIGYGMLMYGLVTWKRITKGKMQLPQPDSWPEVTHLIAAYNESDEIERKIRNSFSLDYPPGKMRLVLIADGSVGETAEIAAKYAGVRYLYEPARRGTISAIHQAMATITSPVVVFSDANTLLNHDAIKNIVRHFESPAVGAVVGEKHILAHPQDSDSAVGESLCWRMESKLKQWDSEWFSAVGSVGELYAIRRQLYEPVTPDSVIEDFIMTMSIAREGYVIAYEPEAYAMEPACLSISEEMKRKVRISAGTFQALSHLRDLFNLFKYGKLSFQFISHLALRWTLAPVGLAILLVLAPLLAWKLGGIYVWLAFAQGLFYTAGGIGWWMERRIHRIKAFFGPFYFLMMNWCLFLGWVRYQKGQ